MSATRIITNHHWRQFKYRYEVPPSVLEDQFDLCDDDDGFIHYRGRWYHLSEFMVTDQFSEWDGFHSDSFFSGILIKLSDDGEEYQVALALS